VHPCEETRDGHRLGDDVVLVAPAGPLALEVVRDAEGNIIGTVINGEVVDNAGNVIGRSVNGQILDGNGRVLYDDVSVTSEATNAVAAELRSVSRDRGIPKIRIVDFIPGGSAKDGITPVLKVRIE
jgi:hypothetical protein